MTVAYRTLAYVWDKFRRQRTLGHPYWASTARNGACLVSRPPCKMMRMMLQLLRLRDSGSSQHESDDYQITPLRGPERLEISSQVCVPLLFGDQALGRDWFRTVGVVATMRSNFDIVRSVSGKEMRFWRRMYFQSGIMHCNTSLCTRLLNITIRLSR